MLSTGPPGIFGAPFEPPEITSANVALDGIKFRADRQPTERLRKVAPARRGPLPRREPGSQDYGVDLPATRRVNPFPRNTLNLDREKIFYPNFK